MSDYAERLDQAQKRHAKLVAMKSVLQDELKLAEDKLKKQCGGKLPSVKLKELTKKKIELEEKIEKGLKDIESKLGNINV